MFNLQVWDYVVLAVVAFVAVTALVRLMQARRDDLMKKLRRDLDQEQTRLKREEKKQKEQEHAEKAA